MLKFQTVTENHQTFKKSLCGKYKVVRYGGGFYAFFKPDGWNNFGNSCEKNKASESRKYKNENAGIAGAQRHHKVFGDNLQQFNSL